VSPAEALRSELLRAIRDNLRDGASQLARRALDALARYAEAPEGTLDDRKAALLAFADELGALRPSMVAIPNLVSRWCDAVRDFDGPAEALGPFARTQAQAVRTWADGARDATVRASLAQLEGAQCILTHSISSTVLEVLKRLPRARTEVIVTESRPGREGWELGATLAAQGHRVSYITDAQGGLFTAQADAVLVGADALLADGTVVNKAGTYLLALAAMDQNVPFWVCAESFKCTATPAHAFALEERSGSELGPPPVPGLKARNLYFEMTPPRLITGWLSNEPLAQRFGQPGA
jgi:translation initiation factor 2B subunit (eIF-2B alpha/beta/delta family)